MRWKRLGRVFNPIKHVLINDCKEFAQCPQFLEFEGFLRIYFCSRSVDKSNGKYFSQVHFVDYSKDFKKILAVSTKTIISLGERGTYDEHGIKPMTFLRKENLIYGYICGLSRKISVSLDASIGLAISKDQGLSFQRLGNGPILTSSLNEPFLIADGSVKIVEGQYYMWYIFGVGWKQFKENNEPERVYKIGQASSRDGIDWVGGNARQIIPSILGEYESQSSPTVIKIGDKYHMFFGYRHSDDFRKNNVNSYKIGHAFSSDLVNWVRQDNDPYLEIQNGEWDSEMQCYPHVFEYNNNIYMLYNGNEFGRYGFGLAILEQ
jgi:hypothetical protein